MRFSLIIQAAPYRSANAMTAYRFAQTLLEQGHELYRVFFYAEAVRTANRFAQVQQDEVNLCQKWQQLAEQYQLDLVVCISAALRQGVIDKSEADRYQQTGDNIAQGFNLSGLGQLVDAMRSSDRIVNFGN